MAVARKVSKEHYRYEERIAILSKEEENEARVLFADYVRRGVIVDCTFDDEIWLLTNGYIKVKIDFRIGKDIYNAKAAHELGCSFANMHTALRVYAVCMMTYALPTVRKHLAAIVRFVRSPETPSDVFDAYAVSEFLELLPGNTPLREEVQAWAYYGVDIDKVRKTRSLADFTSYFQFSHLLDVFWLDATEEERLLYFPVWLWWKLTSILPLRVTEFILTPRKCLSGNENSGWMIRVRRTKLKVERGNAQHSIDDDYVETLCPISDEVAKEIAWYIAATEEEYANDLDTLLSKRTQQRLTNGSSGRDIYFASNLRVLLNRFYDDILVGRYHCVIANGVDKPGAGEINRIRLGDTRHIAIINLMVSGSSLVTCKELCHHFSISTAQNYYANVTAFLDALEWEYIIPVTNTSGASVVGGQANKDKPLLIDLHETTRIPNGWCISRRYATGDFADCASAVNSNGCVGDCGHCRYYIPDKANHQKMKEQNQNELLKVCTLLAEALNCYRRGEGISAPIETILERLKTEASQYRNLSFLERKRIAEGGKSYEQ